MSYAYRYVRNRVVLALALVVVGAVLWWWHAPSETVQRREITATVIEVNSSSTKSFRSGQNVSLRSARVRLEDGRERVVPVFTSPPQPGDRVTLLESVSADGETRYALRSAEPSY